MSQVDRYLEETKFFNFSHPAIQNLNQQVIGNTKLEQAVNLYYLVRDGSRYNPYTFAEGEKAFYASYAAEQEQAYCIPKSSLMVAASRALGIPARLGLADVRNHLSSPRLLEFLGTDLFVMHGYAELYLKDKWVKCTPVFNKQLCEKFHIKPLEFDGEKDSIFHPYTRDDRPHMEYVKDHGTFAELPAKFILQSVAKAYPGVNMHLSESVQHTLENDLEQLAQG